MRRFFLALLVVAACSFGARDATATELRDLRLRDILVHVLQSDPTIPAEWAGVWSITDSLFSCIGPLIEAPPPSIDTLCAGMGIQFEDPSGFGELQCTGTATGTVVDVTCVGSGNAFPDCDYTVTLEFDAILSGDTFSGTMLINIVTTGTAEGCESTTCFLSRFTATRIEPEPTAYCATQALSSSWGRVKAIYR